MNFIPLDLARGGGSLLLYVKRIKISIGVIVVFILCFLQILNDAVGNWKKDYFDQDFEYVVG